MVYLRKQKRNTENHKLANVKWKLNNMDWLLDIEKVNESYFGQQSKSLDIEHRTLENLVETLKDPNDLCGFFIIAIKFK